MRQVARWHTSKRIFLIMPLPRTSYVQLISRSVPHLAAWGTGLGVFLGWPHVWIGASNKMHDVPDINMAYL